MSLSDLLNNLDKYKTHEIRFAGRIYVTVPTEEFRKFQEHFIPTRTWLNNKKNYRSRHIYKHIHAIEYDDRVQFHVDRGNLSKSLFLAIPHAIFDVIPFLLSCLLTLRKPFNTDI